MTFLNFPKPLLVLINHPGAMTLSVVGIAALMDVFSALAQWKHWWMVELISLALSYGVLHVCLALVILRLINGKEA
jgi:hypothetical protein